MAKSFDNKRTLALLGPYVPRHCGIATFTKDLRDALDAKGRTTHTIVLAMDDQPGSYLYPDEVRIQIQENKVQDYRTAADMLNISGVDILLVQHEYGIFGGHCGDYVLALMRRLRMPNITTLHTLLTEPSYEQAGIIHELDKLSDRLVVMSGQAAEILQDVYNVEEQRIAVIPHGIPDVAFVDPAFYKDQFGLEGRTVLLTFGLLSPNKGIEVVIDALPAIVERHPDVTYVVLGAIHPNIFKKDGNAYLHSLEIKAQRLGIRDHVIFDNRYVSLEELCGYIGAADVYLTPYINEAQIVSGTLAYAMGAGKAIVSTPYWYAKEMLKDDRGRFFAFDDTAELAVRVNELLDDPVGRAALRKRAYMHCRPLIWEKVGNAYLQLCNDILHDRSSHPRPVFYFRSTQSDFMMIPEVNVSHIQALTDDTGILQHAVCAVPNRAHGYCTDDNARALLTAMRYHHLSKDASILPYVGRYMSFLHYAFDESTKSFRNFMSYERLWITEEWSEDVHGRVIHALGQTVALAPNDAVLSFASGLLSSAMEKAETLRSPRAWANALLGMRDYLDHYSGDARVRRIRAVLARRLHEQFENNGSADWPWCEDIVTYDNAKLPHGLIVSAHATDDEAMLACGMRSLGWLVDLQLDGKGVISLIGNKGWLRRDGHRSRFDQQPIEAMGMVEACADAYRVTGDKIWRERAEQFLTWFLGNNETESMLYDYATGGCRDGLNPQGPNLNQGAESTIAWLVALMTIHTIHEGTQVAQSEELKNGNAPAARIDEEPVSVTPVAI